MNNRLNGLDVLVPVKSARYTNQMSVEKQQELTLHILEILNTQSSKVDVIREVVLEIKKFTQLSAVGIRLKDGNDYPYYECSGFSQSFIRSEMHLCSNSSSDDDKNNSSCLECMCGAVIMGKTDSAPPFFSHKGSFWTNSTSEFLSNVSLTSFNIKTRNRCYKDGYESVALIPLKSGDETIGLLQLNDEENNMFTIEYIKFFEKLSNCVGVAMSRKETEEKREKSKRAFQLLSECNHTMVKAQNETEFLNDICNLIVNVGGYRLAWVGFAEQSETKFVRPVAQKGYELGYLDTLKITWDESKYGQGPTGQAIKKNLPVVVNNILTDKNYTPWRESAMQRGFQSSIALPLIGDHYTLGALNIYSPEPNSFDKDDLKLLVKLAKNVSYGIEVLRSNKIRKLTETNLQKSEKKLLGAQKIAHLGYYVFNIVSGVWTSSNELNQILGIDISYQKSVSSWLKIVHPDHQELISQYLLDDILRQNKKFDKEYKIIDVATGEEKWVHGLGELKLDAQGNPVEMFGTIQDITEHKNAEKALQESNIALKEILKTIEIEKKEQMLSVQAHVNRTVLPLVRKLEIGSTDLQSNYISLIVDNLNTIVSPFIGKLESKFVNLTPREVEICKMLKDGLTSEEIAETLSTSVSTVFGQRKKIRKKLGLTNNNTNLVSFLNSL